MPARPKKTLERGYEYQNKKCFFVYIPRGNRNLKKIPLNDRVKSYLINKKTSLKTSSLIKLNNSSSSKDTV